MIMHYILIVAILSGNNLHTLTMQEFNDHDSCAAAMTIINTELLEPHVKTWCVVK